MKNRRVSQTDVRAIRVLMGYIFKIVICNNFEEEMTYMKLFSLVEDELTFLKQGLELNAPLMRVFDVAYENCQVCHSVCATGCGASKS